MSPQPRSNNLDRSAMGPAFESGLFVNLNQKAVACHKVSIRTSHLIGPFQEYLQPLEELQLNMKNRMEVGAVLRELRLSNIQCKFEAEQMATEQNFQSEKELLWDYIKADLEDRVRKLEEDKNNVDFSTGLWEQTSSSLKSSRRKKADPLDPDRRKKPVTVTGPYIVYMLREPDIIDDWTLIKKSLQQQRVK